LRRSFVDIALCPECRSDLALQTNDAGPDFAEGFLRCTTGHVFQIIDGVPRFVATDGYAENFGIQWNLHDRTQLDTDTSHESEATFMEKTGFTKEEIAGKSVLDVGCGMGRFSEVASRCGATVVGIDLTSAVNAARRNLRDRGVELAQADVFKLPFRDESFDFIFSIGVLHHTPSTKDAFARLPRLLKAGGKIAIWVYAHSRLTSHITDVYRVGTKRLPKPLLYRLSRLAIPLYHVHRTPLVGAVTRRALPTSMHADPEWRALDTFDWYSPKYQWKHTDEELRRWFMESGLVDLRKLPSPVSMQGTRAPRSG
jgi:ubiquinone/menaquinone biosynthesis C-methylase UbiE/uncharacterized protein YbaR (Trm112 family)